MLFPSPAPVGCIPVGTSLSLGCGSSLGVVGLARIGGASLDWRTDRRLAERSPLLAAFPGLQVSPAGIPLRVVGRSCPADGSR
ncbi:hypothetical protein K9N68_39330 (plasmid) [Kovacikia minuta CCNUW1]|uniref:hypothetical protein n=1 Tax=Kovacikia minuta TaxID=2931930 RepID=UPI001CC9E612|nr:hypothetical protein [Kovacikia minuta]UBF30191.1 hypothetical protein K9N68_39330 [Kovacikia minuta CCNUW1]